MSKIPEWSGMQGFTEKKAAARFKENILKHLDLNEWQEMSYQEKVEFLSLMCVTKLDDPTIGVARAKELLASGLVSF